MVAASIQERYNSIITRSKTPRKITFTPEERSVMIRLAEPLGRSVQEHVAAVHPKTFLRWMRQADRIPNRRPGPRGGKPRIAQEVVDLILRMARENLLWSHHRIHGELMKLGIRISKTSVYNYLKANGIEPSRSRRVRPWAARLSSAPSLLVNTAVTPLP